jgi:hypothetical protein
MGHQKLTCSRFARKSNIPESGLIRFKLSALILSGSGFLIFKTQQNHALKTFQQNNAKFYFLMTF